MLRVLFRKHLKVTLINPYCVSFIVSCLEYFVLPTKYINMHQYDFLMFCFLKCALYFKSVFITIAMRWDILTQRYSSIRERA